MSRLDDEIEKLETQKKNAHLGMSKTRAGTSTHGPKYEAEDYLYSVVWSVDDQAFIGRVLEFPSLAAHGSTQEKALREIRSVVRYALEDLADSRELAPEP